MNHIRKHPSTSALFWATLLALFAISCAPQKQGVRAAVKTGSTNLNPAVSGIADQQATAQNAIYKISTVSVPIDTDTGVLINSDLLNPSSQYLPITTRHENGQLDSSGIFNDSSRGIQVRVAARCSDSVCTKYLLLVTVTRNNVAVYQSAAVSFKDDCNFYTSSTSDSTGAMFQTIDALSSRYAGLQPTGDTTSCQP